MPLKKSSSKRALSENFDELREGKTFKRTAKKYGKRKAVAQMQAIALSNQRKYSRKRSPKRDRKKR